jgi:class 3 adenylate cyclase/tetratricopeptide (TPR) repeat protein
MQRIEDWLRNLGMAEYAERFAGNDIEFSVLRHLTDQDLKELGVSLGHRRKMLAAIAELACAPPPTSSSGNVIEHRPKDAAERRQLTVMFCDLVGSTALSARLDPEDLRSIIAAYHSRCTELVERNGGFVAKYMGDGVLAYFGYPQAHEHDAERAVRAGLALVEAVPKLTTVAAVPLQVRIGIATGLVVVGDLIGTGAAQEQAVIGETPNLAARLQALAEPSTVVIASSTRQLTAGLFEYRDLGSIALKGFAKEVWTWQVLGASAAESRFEALRATTTPLIGREEEIDLLLRRWEQAKRGDGAVVLISGEPGIGKSRIAQTIVERLSSEPHTRLRYFCSPHHQDSALYPSIAQLERAAALGRHDTDEQRLAKLEAVLAEGTDDLREAVPLLADLMLIPTGNRYPPLNLTPQKRKEKRLYAQLAQLEGLTVRNPVLMVWEDIQWSDPTTRESLDLLIERVPALRVLVIITYRPEFTPPWIGRPQLTLLSLSRLPPRQCAEMITHVTGGKGMPKDIADQIVDRTDGVPLFIEELTKSVLESGVLTETGDHYTVMGPVAPLAIPTTLHASLLARLDRLAPTREVAQIGAALGRRFSHELISAVAQMPQHQVDDSLAQLVRAELIFRRGVPPDAEYTFKHALVQDAAYSTLLRSRRHQIHSRIASTLEGKFPEIVTAQPQVIAQHYAEAGLCEKAVEYSLKAGQLAVARSGMTEAVTQLQRGLDQLSSVPDSSWRQQHELNLRVALGQALTATKGYSASEVGDAIAQARVLAERLNRSDDIVPLLHAEWIYRLSRAEYSLAHPLAERIETNGQAQNNVAAICLGRSKKAWTQYQRAQFVAARTLIEQCQELSDPAHGAVYLTLIASDYHIVMFTYHAFIVAQLGFLDQARARMNEALSQARRLGHAHTLAHVLVQASGLEAIAGTPHEVRRYAEEAVALSNEHGFMFWLGLGMLLLGHSMIALGQGHGGLTLLTKGLSVYRSTGAVMLAPSSLMLLGEAYARLGRPIEGLDHLTEAAQTIEMTDERCQEAWLHVLRGDLLDTAGDRAAAEYSYQQALAVAGRQSAKTPQLYAAARRARLMGDQGKRAEARDLLAPIYGWFTEGFDAPILQHAKAVLDELV